VWVYNDKPIIDNKGAYVEVYPELSITDKGQLQAWYGNEYAVDLKLNIKDYITKEVESIKDKYTAVEFEKVIKELLVSEKLLHIVNDNETSVIFGITDAYGNVMEYNIPKVIDKPHFTIGKFNITLDEKKVNNEIVIEINYIFEKNRPNKRDFIISYDFINISNAIIDDHRWGVWLGNNNGINEKYIFSDIPFVTTSITKQSNYDYIMVFLSFTIPISTEPKAVRINILDSNVNEVLTIPFIITPSSIYDGKTP
jgi:hypothetical protein